MNDHDPNTPQEPRRRAYRKIVDVVSTGINPGLAKQIETLQSELTAARTRIGDLVSSLDLSRGEMDKLLAKHHALQSTLQTTAAERQAAEVELRTITGERNAAIEDYRALLAQRNELQQGLDLANTETKRIADERQAAINDYQTLRARSQDLQRSLDAAIEQGRTIAGERASALADYELLSGEHNQLQQRLDATLSELSRIDGERQAAINDFKVMQFQRDELQRRLDSAEDDIKRLDGERRAAVDDFRASQRQRDELQRQLDDTEVRLNTATGERQAAIDDFRALQRQRAELQQRLDGALADVRRITGERQAAIDDFRAMQRQRDELQQRLDTTEVELKTAAGERQAAISDYQALLRERDRIQHDRDEILAEGRTLRQERDSLWSIIHGEYAKRLESIQAENEALKRENASQIELLRNAEEDGENLSRTAFTVQCPPFPAGFTGMASPKDEANLHRHLEGLRRIYLLRADPQVRSACIADMLCVFGRHMHFLNDPDFIEAFKRNLINASDETRLWRLHTLLWAAKSALPLDGDFVQCGVFEGFAAAVLCDALGFSKIKKRFFLYDTFAGLDEGFSSPEERQAVHGAGYDRPNLHEDVVRRFSQYRNVKVIRGVVPAILSSQAPSKVALLHIDMKSAKAEIGALEILFRRVAPGGIVVLEDFGRLPSTEQHLAERKWFAKQGHTVCELPTGQGIIVKLP